MPSANSHLLSYRDVLADRGAPGDDYSVWMADPRRGRKTAGNI